MLKKERTSNRLSVKDIDFDVQNMLILKTRKQSSRIRIVRCSGRLGGVGEGGVCVQGVCVRGVCVSGGCVQGCVYPSIQWGRHPPPKLADRILDTRLIKH